jgi:lipopolysaccharide transport system permease protein
MIFKNYDLIFKLISREISEKYTGTVLGIFWVVLNPLLLVFVYCLVFTQIFKASWAENSSPYYYFMMLYCGLIVFNLYSDIINKSTNILDSNKNFITKIKFPIEILLINSVGVSLFNASLNFLILILFSFYYFGEVNFLVLYLPFILTPFLIILLGISFIFSIVGVYFKDFKNIVSFLLALQYFMTPIFYPLSRVPEKYRFYIETTPVTFTIEQVRYILIERINPNFYELLVYLIISIIILMAMSSLFNKCKSGLSDAF